MPPGVPVATVALDAGQNAGILAAQILGASDPEILAKVAKFKEDLKIKVQKGIKELSRGRFGPSSLDA